LSILLGVLVVLSTPGSAVAALPSWVKNPESEYPASQYLTAVGSAAALPGAKKKAKAEINNILSQEIESSQTMDEQTRESTIDGDHKFAQELKMRTQIEVKSAGELIGVQIKNSESVFHDGRTRYYALAVLDKNKAIDNYRDRFNDNNEILRERYEKAKEEEDPLRKLQYLTEARRAANEAKQYKNQAEILRNLGAEGEGNFSDEGSSSGSFFERASSFGRDRGENSGSGKSSRSSSRTSGSQQLLELHVTPAQIDREIDSIMDELSVEVGEFTFNNICEGSGFEEQLRSNVREQFTKLDFQTSPDGEPLVKTAGRLSANYTSKGRETDAAVRWDITIELKNGRTGRTIGTINESSVTVSSDKQKVASRTRYDIKTWLNENLDSLIADKLLNT
jgi:hypothetical protein